MKEKLKTICLILITVSIVAFAITYTFRALIDYGCSSPKLFSTKEGERGTKWFASRSFLGVNCFLWEKLLQFQQNY